MGTRNLTIVKVDNKTKIAQYCQWDGYPTGQGKTVAEFIHNHMELDKFKEQVKALKWATKKRIKDTWTQAGADPDSSMVSMAIADQHKEIYPEFSRDTGADILRLIQDGVVETERMVKRHDDYAHINNFKTGFEVNYVQNDRSFIKEGDCEFAYELDLDKETVKVYAGGNNVFGTYTFEEFTPEFMEMLEKLIDGYENREEADAIEAAHAKDEANAI